jgi:hypothetical protein
MLGATGELFDATFGSVELGLAEGVELLAALPQLQRLVERRLPALESLDDLLELCLRLLERLRLLRLGQGVTSSTRAPKPPSASVTSTCAPVETSSAAATTSPESVRTIA